MSEHKDKRVIDGLSRVIRVANPEGVGFDRPDDDLIWAYLSGHATEEQRDQVQVAMLASSEFRQEIQEIIRDESALLGEEVGDAFARIEERNSGVEHVTWLSRLRSLCWTPAFAYTALVLAMAWPSYQMLNSDGPSSVLRAQTVSLIGETGSDDSRVAAVRVDRSAEVVDITIWDTSRLSRSSVERYRATLSNIDGVLWVNDDFQGIVETESELGYRFIIETKLLQPGEYQLAIEKIARAEVSATTTVRFTVEE